MRWQQFLLLSMLLLLMLLLRMTTLLVPGERRSRTRKQSLPRSDMSYASPVGHREGEFTPNEN